MYLCPSMMCASYTHLLDEIKELEQANIDIFHLDVMDGHFVPNIGMGMQDIEMIAKYKSKLCDIHLMVENPSKLIDKFLAMNIDIIYIHPESERQTIRLLQKIKDAGKEVGIAINPETSFEMVKEILPLVDKVLIMTVNPGFSGQPYLPFIDNKIKQFIAGKSNYHYEIFVDGAISIEKIHHLHKQGVEGFILGTKALFNKEESYQKIIKKIREGE